LVFPLLRRGGPSFRVLSAVLAVVLVLIATALGARLIAGLDEEPPGSAQFRGTGLTTEDSVSQAEPTAPDPGGSATAGAPGPTSAGAQGTDTPLADGDYRIRAANTGLCVGEGPELEKDSGRDGVLGQHPCATASPRTVLERLGDALYRIKLVERQYDTTTCAAVDNGGLDPDLLLSGRECDLARPEQKFFVEPVRTPVAGYRLRSMPGRSFCVGVYLASKKPGMQLISTTCNGGKDQVFTFERG
jgi:hypothetical protein